MTFRLRLGLSGDNLTNRPADDGTGDAAALCVVPVVANTVSVPNIVRRNLRLVPRDELAAMVEAFHRQLGPAPSDVTEYPDKNGRGPTLFRHSFGVEEEQSMHSIPAHRLTPHVRLKLQELMDAIEEVAP